MPRRRLVQQEQKAEFLSANTNLVEFETEIRPGSDNWGRLRPEVSQGNNDSTLLDSEDGDLTVSVGRFSVDLPVPDTAIPGLVSTAPLFEGGGLEMTASPDLETSVRVVIFNVDVEVPSSVVVTDMGFGVASFEDLEALEDLPENPEGSLVDLLGSIVSIGGDESLDIGIRGEFENPFMQMPGGGGEQQGLEKLEPAAALEGRALGFDFDIVSGSGNVVVNFMTSDGMISEEIFSPGGGSRLRSAAPETQFFSNGPEGGFTDFSISTTGDLEIVVTGINLTTGMGDPLDIV